MSMVESLRNGADFGYWDSIVAARSAEVDEQSALLGNTLLSAETVGDLCEVDFQEFADFHPEKFFAVLRKLSPECQDVILSTYQLNKCQTSVAKAVDRTQTVVSQILRVARLEFGAYIMCGGEPPWATIASVGGESVADIVEAYRECGSFSAAGEQLGLRRVDVRRALSETAKRLLESNGAIQQAVGAYLHSTVFDKNPNGTGVKKRRTRLAGLKFVSDPECLGDFRVRIEDADLDALFNPHSMLD